MTLLKSDFVHRDGPPLNIVSASGASLYAEGGRRYIDLQASSGACALGYRSDLLECSLERLARLPSKPQFCESSSRTHVASALQTIIESSTGCKGKLAFDLGGAQAIEHALKIVSAARPTSTTVLVFDGAYHGRSLAVSHLSCSARYLSGEAAGQFKVVRLPVPAMRARMYGISLDEATALCEAEVTALLTDERFGIVGGVASLHSFVFEPVLNVAGIIPVAPEYIRFIISQVKSLGGYAVADEIFTGFHKTGGFLATAEYAKEVDVIVMSKGLTNGMAALSAIWVNDNSGLAECVKSGTHSSTYINNELGFAIAQEVLKVRERLEPHDLTAPQRKLTVLFDAIKRTGMDAEFFLHHNLGRITLPDNASYQRVTERLKNHGDCGVLTAVTGLARNTLIFHPALTISDDEMELATQAAVAAFAAG